MFDIVKDGQLHVFNAALAAAGIYDIVKHVVEDRDAATLGALMVMIGLLLLLLAAEVFMFADAAALNARLPPGQIGPTRQLAVISIVMLVATVVLVLTFRILTDTL